MGFSEWGILIKSQDDIIHLLEIIKRHNEKEDSSQKYGESLTLYSIIEYEKKKYACIGNYGGRDLTSEYLFKNAKFKKIYYPFEKPEGWFDNKKFKYLWQSKNIIPNNLWNMIK